MPSGGRTSAGETGPPENGAWMSVRIAKLARLRRVAEGLERWSIFVTLPMLASDGCCGWPRPMGASPWYRCLLDVCVLSPLAWRGGRLLGVGLNAAGGWGQNG